MRWKPRLRGGRDRRSRLSAVLIASCFLAGCSRQTASTRDAYHSAELQFRNANLDQCISDADHGAQRASGRERARLRLLQAQCLLARNRSEDATAILRSPETTGVASGDVQARRAMLQGVLFARRDEFERAHASFDEALRTAAAFGDGQTQIETQLSRALTWSKERKLDAADEALSSALTIAKASRDEYHQAAAELNRALFAARRNRFDEAAMMFQGVLTLCDRRHDTGILRSAALGNLSMCYARLGDLERAKAIRQQAIDFQEKSGLARYIAESFGEMGYISLQDGDPAAAVSWFQRASDLAGSAGPGVDTAAFQGGLAQALLAIGKLDEAGRAIENSAQLRRQINDEEGRGLVALTQARIAAARGDLPRGIRTLEHLVAGIKLDHLLWEAHAELAQLYRRTGQLNSARMHQRWALAFVDKITADVLRPEFRITYLSRLIHFYQDVVADLIADGRDDDALALADATHARVLAERLRSKTTTTEQEPFRPERFAESSDATLLSYWISPRGSHVWVITGQQVRRKPLADVKLLQTLAEAHAREVDALDRDPLTISDSAAERLYDQLIGPIESLVPRGGRVILVPDGPLHAINFETLVARSPKPHYWIEDVTLSVAPSMALLRPPAQLRASGLAKVLLIGDPVAVDKAYPPLRFAGSELNTVGQLFRERVRIAGNDATPAAYLQAAAGDYSAIHFAAHAEANATSPLDSAIILSPDHSRYKLYSRDIGEHPIHADLVTLSACRGAGARTYSGEGLVGFAWSFLQAGAGNVIAGLWDVSDRSTAMLMRKMYETLAADAVEPSVALREAKLMLLRSGRPEAHPWYWAPYQLYSRTAPVKARAVSAQTSLLKKPSHLR